MKKTALLTLCVFIVSQSYADSCPCPAISPKITGSAKLIGSAVSLAGSLFALKQSWTNFSASRNVSQGEKITWCYSYIPVPTALMPAASRSAQRTLSHYQFGTSGFAALLAKRLYDSGMSDLRTADTE